MTVLIVLLWAIGGIPTPSGGSRSDHTGDDGNVRVIVGRRPEAAMASSPADSDSDDAPPVPPVSAPPSASDVPAPPPSPITDRLTATASIPRPGSPRGPPSLG